MKKLTALLCLLFFSVNVCLAQTVIYNVKTGKIHKISCPAAQKCTVNCIKIEKKEAQARGGVPCKKCGG